MDKKNFSFLNIYMTAQTTSDDIQEKIEEKLEKRTKELYIPLTGIFIRLFNIYLYKYFIRILNPI